MTVTSKRALFLRYLNVNRPLDKSLGNKTSMKKKDERRSLYRIEISGSMVFYKKNKGYKIFNRYSNISQLKNITKSGACLEIKNGIKKGERFKLLLVIPGEKKFEIMGRVRWK